MHIGRKFWSPHFCGSYVPWNLENILKSTNNLSFLCQFFINEITASDAGPDIIRSHLFLNDQTTYPRGALLHFNLLEFASFVACDLSHQDFAFNPSFRISTNSMTMNAKYRAGNGDVSKWMKNSQVRWKTSTKETNTLYRSDLIISWWHFYFLVIREH